MRPRGRRFVAAVAAFSSLILIVPAAGATAPAKAPAVHLPFPLPAPAALPAPCPPPYVPPGPPPPPLPAPVVAEKAVPIVSAPAPHQVDLAAISGKGIWITVFPGDPVNPAAIVATAKAAGLHQIWIRTGSTYNGFYGGSFLPALVADAHARRLYVVAWDFPEMSNPAADALRAKEAFADGADAFSADIESSAEGTYLTGRRVAYYLSLVRQYAGDRPVVATVMPPSTYWLARYPYAAEAPFVDAFAPMVYWDCTEPGRAVAESIAGLASLHRPVAPIGQDYNMATEGGRQGLPTPQEIWRFLDVARRDGAIGASLYDLEAGGSADLSALGAYPWVHALTIEATS